MFRKCFGLEKYFSFFDRKCFRSKILRRKFFRSHIPILKIPKIPKITLRKLCDEAWCLKTKYIIPNHEFIINFLLFTHRKNKCLTDILELIPPSD